MFLGHYAVAFAAKPAAPRASLGALVGAAQLPDLLWPLFLLFGWEHIAPGDRGFTALRFVSYPWSHSLLFDLGWGALAGIAYLALTRDRRGAGVIALLVVSHWVLDFVSHRPDMPLYPGGGPQLGLGLWNWPVATVVIEGALSIAGLAVYLRHTRPTDGAGRYALWGLVVLLVAIYATSLTSRPPSDMRAVAWGAMASWLIPIWAWWIDRHRMPRHAGGATGPARA